ncbi:helix-turn-helix transcriptional regulator [Paenibacillus xylanivorans]|uniref:AraC family transcriptional regulator n=1 Tax=Paenibacillus xylanivorans TaxID=1705561 RepID=A0A0M9BNJ8_9BACL|nr:AraC family transcriptional regulator [Paenibacillus xylanivorans]KOY15823.1 AraC family transcriptional regulator [Paenibacillus xylanivorans]
MGFDSLSVVYQHYLTQEPFSQQDKNTYLLSAEAGSGNIKRVTTYSGIEIVHSQIEYHEPYPTYFASDIPIIELQFALSGARYVDISGQEYTLSTGQGALIMMRDFEAWFHPPAKENYTSFALGIPISLFNYAGAHLATSQCIRFQDILGHRIFKPIVFQLDHRIRTMIDSLIVELNNPYRSSLMMEATALEILNRFMIQLFDLAPIPVGFSREDIRKLHTAREIMENCMVDPPSLLALSKQVGLNDFKLKKGFKALFGTTVFEYLRQIRLDSAMKLLRNQENNVTEAAIAVGYSNISAFSQQFYRKFGVKPSEMKKIF